MGSISPRLFLQTIQSLTSSDCSYSISSDNLASDSVAFLLLAPSDQMTKAISGVIRALWWETSKWKNQESIHYLNGRHVLWSHMTWLVKSSVFHSPLVLNTVRNLKELLEKSQMNETGGWAGRWFSGESSKNKRAATPSHILAIGDFPGGREHCV